MFTNKLNVREYPRRLLLALPAIWLITGQSAWSQMTPGDFEMRVYEDSAQGYLLSAGRYEEALAIEVDNGPDSFDDFNNRCVLLTLTKSYAEAEAICAAAVEINTIGNAKNAGWKETAKLNKQKAMALINRGVLRAVSGNFEAARTDFEAVLALGHSVNSAKANLFRLAARANKKT